MYSNFLPLPTHPFITNTNVIIMIFKKKSTEIFDNWGIIFNSKISVDFGDIMKKHIIYHLHDE